MWTAAVPEQEADRVADQVVRALAPRRGAAPIEAPPGLSEGLRSPGVPLDSASRTFFEPRFGHDLSNVRIHADSPAAASAASIEARAYTVGRDIVFGERQHAPATHAGKRLLAHELTHVLQQRVGGVAVQRASLENPATESAPPPEAATAEADPRFDGFPPVLRAALQYAEGKALEVLDRMMVELLPWLVTQETQDAFAKQFRTLNPNRLLLVIRILRRVREKLPTVRYVYDEHCNAFAWTLPVEVGPIYICPPFFAEKDVGVRYNTLIHEGAHHFACRLGDGYVWKDRYYEFSALRQLWNAEPYGELAEEMGAQPERTP